ncbi:MAG: hypothetical protein GTO02_23035, partial [Candidatus Dadabacteria bacterium]|nr:hypothetical protein [Candidatus Dadabacteria bacterium]
MNKWSRIKDKIYQEKLDEVNVIFDTVSENINNLKIPRSAWVTPLAEWATIQISDKNSPKLSLQEYAHFKKFINDFGDSLAIRNNEKEQVVKEFRSFFLEDYQEALERKENEIKLEVAAEIIEEKQFPLEVFAEWYIEHWSLPQEKF